jgi:hypothetical protein
LQELLALIQGIIVCIDDLHIDAKAARRLLRRCLLFLLIIVIPGREGDHEPVFFHLGLLQISAYSKIIP